MRFTERVVVVTGGGGSGLGSSLAHHFAAEGARVAIVDADSDAARAVASAVRADGGQALAVRTDVRREDDVDAMVDTVTGEFGHIDVLVNNAFTSNPAPLLEARFEDWVRDIDVVLNGTFLCSQRVLRSMVGRRKGAIVNISSVNAHTHVGASSYSAAKAGVEALTRNLAVEHAPYGIRANAVVPGTFRTDVWKARQRIDPDILDRLASFYPLGRVGTTDDIAAAVLFLASDDASWITGALLPVDGGLLAGNPQFAWQAHPENPVVRP